MTHGTVTLKKKIRQFVLHTSNSRNNCKCYWQQLSEKNCRAQILSWYECCIWFDQTQYCVRSEHSYGPNHKCERWNRFHGPLNVLEATVEMMMMIMMTMTTNNRCSLQWTVSFQISAGKNICNQHVEDRN